MSALLRNAPSIASLALTTAALPASYAVYAVHPSAASASACVCLVAALACRFWAVVARAHPATAHPALKAV